MSLGAKFSSQVPEWVLTRFSTQKLLAGAKMATLGPLDLDSAI